MCGRFVSHSSLSLIEKTFNVDSVAAELKPNYNIAPTQTVPVIVRNHQTRLDMFHWGLVPFWAKDPAIGNRMINARAETVAEKPSYRNAFKHRRCVVLADGFYEWHRDGSAKIPYFITTEGSEPFGLAALWESWTDKSTGEHVESTTLITTSADDYIQKLHHRMPVVLDPALAGEWLAGNDELIGPGAPMSPPLTAWPVDRRVNNARNEGKDLIDAVGDPLER